MINLLGMDSNREAHLVQMILEFPIVMIIYMGVCGAINFGLADRAIVRNELTLLRKIYAIRKRYGMVMDTAKENFIAYLKTKETESQDPFFGAYRRAFELAVAQEKTRTRILCDKENEENKRFLKDPGIKPEEIPLASHLPRGSLPVFRCIENVTTKEFVFLQLPYEVTGIPFYPDSHPKLKREKVTSWEGVQVPAEVALRLRDLAKKKKPSLDVSDQTHRGQPPAVEGVKATSPSPSRPAAAPPPAEGSLAPRSADPVADSTEDLLADFQVASPSRMAAKASAMAEMFRRCREAGKDLGKYLVMQVLVMGKRCQFIHPVVVPEAIHPISQRLIETTTCDRPVLSAKPKPHDPATLRRDIWLKEALIWCPEGSRPEDHQEKTRAKPGPVSYTAEDWHLLLAQVRRNQVEETSPHRYTPEQEALLDQMFKDNQASVAVGLPSVHDFGPDFWAEKMGLADGETTGGGSIPPLRRLEEPTVHREEIPRPYPNQDDHDDGEEWKRGTRP